MPTRGAFATRPASSTVGSEGATAARSRSALAWSIPEGAAFAAQQEALRTSGALVASLTIRLPEDIRPVAARANALALRPSADRCPAGAAPLDDLSAGAFVFGASMLARLGGETAIVAEALERASRTTTDPTDLARLRLTLAALSASEGRVVASEVYAVDGAALRTGADRKDLATLLARLAADERTAGNAPAAKRAALASLRAGGPRVPEHVASGASDEARLALLVAVGDEDAAAELALDRWLAEKSNLRALQTAASMWLRRALRLEDGSSAAPSNRARLEARRVAWDRAIAMWAIIVTWNVFWELFPVERGMIHKKELGPKDIEDARMAVTTRIVQLTTEVEARHRDVGRTEDALQAARIRDAFRDECAAARALSEVMRAGTTAGLPALPFPCGPLALDLLGLHDQVVHALSSADRSSQAAPAARSVDLDCLARFGGSIADGWELVTEGRFEDAASLARGRLRAAPRDRAAQRLLLAIAKKRIQQCLTDADVDRAEDTLLHWFPGGDVALEVDREVWAALRMMGDVPRALRVIRAMRKAKDTEQWRLYESRLLVLFAATALEDGRGLGTAIELLIEAKELAPRDGSIDYALAAHADALVYALISAGSAHDAVIEMDWLEAEKHDALRDFLALALEARAIQHANGGKLDGAAPDVTAAHADLSRALACADDPGLRGRLRRELADLALLRAHEAARPVGHSTEVTP